MSISLTQSKLRRILAILLAAAAAFAAVQSNMSRPVAAVAACVFFMCTLFFLLTEIRLSPIWQVPCMLLTPLITLWCVELLQAGNPLDMAPTIFLFNYVLYALPVWCFFLLTNSIKLSLLPSSAFFLILGVVNHYVILFRNSALQPWDLAAAQTAANVLPAMKLAVDSTVLMSISWFLLLCILCMQISSKNFSRHAYHMLRFACAPMCVIVCVLTLLSGDFPDPTESRENFWDTIFGFPPQWIGSQFCLLFSPFVQCTPGGL